MIKWKNIDLSFSGKEILKNFTLEVSQGEKVLFSNRSGSGKTTLLKIAMGLVNSYRGEVHIDFDYLNSDNIDHIRSKIFYLDQDVTLPELIVIDLIEEIYNYKHNRNKKFDKNLFLKYLNEFNLHNDIMGKNVKELSGGERQRLGLIIGLMLKRPIWLLDEPTSALDKKLKEKVKDKILSMDITAVIISHDNCWDCIEKVSWSNS